jgi:hypothetical protein
MYIAFIRLIKKINNNNSFGGNTLSFYYLKNLLLNTYYVLNLLNTTPKFPTITMLVIVDSQTYFTQKNKYA